MSWWACYMIVSSCTHRCIYQLMKTHSAILKIIEISLFISQKYRFFSLFMDDILHSMLPNIIYYTDIFGLECRQFQPMWGWHNQPCLASSSLPLLFNLLFQGSYRHFSVLIIGLDEGVDSASQPSSAFSLVWLEERDGDGVTFVKQWKQLTAIPLLGWMERTTSMRRCR